VYEAASIPATFSVASRAIAPQIGTRDLPAGDLSIRYPLGSVGTKTVAFSDSGAHVSVEHRRAFVEQLPLLVRPTDSLSSTPGQFTLRRGPTRFLVRWTPAVAAMVTRTGESVGDRHVVVVTIPGADSLTYDVRFK
jgi:hypothetical protein